MPDHDAAFAGSIPAFYDAALGPLFFEPYARDLASRLNVPSGGVVLEIAAGTGLLTRQLLSNLPAEARLVATDLNEGMIAVAKDRIGADPRVEWKTVDASALPFADETFDAVVCQFGLMFFPDKALALAEARRVLKPAQRRGTPSILLNVWGLLDENPLGQIAHETIGSFFHVDPPQFYRTPFGLDQATVEHLLTEAGFKDVRCETVDKIAESETAELAAEGLILGSPVSLAIQERGTVAPEVIIHAIAARLTEQGGAAPMRLPMRARVFTALR